eukprot:9472518-Pyramimonas_sp.AAC.1
MCHATNFHLRRGPQLCPLVLPVTQHVHGVDNRGPVGGRISSLNRAPSKLAMQGSGCRYCLGPFSELVRGFSRCPPLAPLRLDELGAHVELRQPRGLERGQELAPLPPSEAIAMSQHLMDLFWYFAE